MDSGKVNYNYKTMEFPSEEGPGASLFFKDSNDQIYHTYSSYERGLDILVGAYNFLDLAPRGRDEEGLSFSMAWVRHHDKYEGRYFVDAGMTYEQPKVISKLGEHACCSGEQRP